MAALGRGLDTDPVGLFSLIEIPRVYSLQICVAEIKEWHLKFLARNLRQTETRISPIKIGLIRV